MLVVVLWKFGFGAHSLPVVFLPVWQGSHLVFFGLPCAIFAWNRKISRKARDNSKTTCDPGSCLTHVTSLGRVTLLFVIFNFFELFCLFFAKNSKLFLCKYCKYKELRCLKRHETSQNRSETRNSIESGDLKVKKFSNSSLNLHSLFLTLNFLCNSPQNPVRVN